MSDDGDWMQLPRTTRSKSVFVLSGGLPGPLLPTSDQSRPTPNKSTPLSQLVEGQADATQDTVNPASISNKTEPEQAANGFDINVHPPGPPKTPPHASSASEPSDVAMSLPTDPHSQTARTTLQKSTRNPDSGPEHKNMQSDEGSATKWKNTLLSPSGLDFLKTAFQQVEDTSDNHGSMASEAVSGTPREAFWEDQEDGH